MTPPPVKLYRYQPPRLEWLRSVVLDKKLYFSSPRNFNDPFDCRLDFDFSGKPQEWNKRLASLCRELHPELSPKKRAAKVAQMVRHRHEAKFAEAVSGPMIDMLGVLCLTKKRDNLLMWAHYAANHTGYCLEFFNSVRDLMFASATPVTYQDQYYRPKYVKIKTNEVILDMLKTKSTDWEYEQEWRIIAHPEWPYAGPGNHLYTPDLLTGIIFGCEVDSSFKKDATQMILASQRNIKLYQATKKADAFGLDIRPIGS